MFDFKLYGYKNGGIFVNFVFWIIQSSKFKDYDKIYYFTREGIFFKKIHDMIRETYYESKNCPKSEILEVSRMSTYFSSLTNCTKNDFESLWSQYPNQNIHEFLTSLNIENDEIMNELLNKFKICKHDNICNSIFWTHTELVNQLIALSSLNKNNLLKYLEQKGINKNTKKICVVDIGWRGTIQDNLAKILEDTFIEGYYFGLIPFLNNQPNNVTKTGFCNRFFLSSLLLSSPTPIEFFCLSPTGSIISYDDKNSLITPIQKIINAEVNIWKKYLSRFQNGVLKQTINFCEYAKKNKRKNLKILEYKNIIKFFLLISFPNINVVNIYLTYEYNEYFGLGKIEKTIKSATNKNIKDNFNIYLSCIKHMKWPQAFFVCKKIFFLLPLLNIFIFIKKQFIKFYK